MTSQWARWGLISPASRLFAESSVQAHIKKSKLRVTCLYEENSPVTGEFLAPRAINAENVTIWWRHHDRMSRQLHEFHDLYIDSLMQDCNISNALAMKILQSCATTYIYISTFTFKKTKYRLFTVYKKIFCVVLCTSFAGLNCSSQIFVVPFHSYWLLHSSAECNKMLNYTRIRVVFLTKNGASWMLTIVEQPWNDNRKLTDCGLVAPYGDADLSQHWLR